MWQDAVGDPWTPQQAVEAAADATWIDVCALTRTDFPPATLAALDPGGRQLLVDLQGPRAHCRRSGLSARTPTSATCSSTSRSSS